jgi:hypothetical protein
MEVAFLLLIFVFAECALTVWLLARHRDYLRRVQRLENEIIKNTKEEKDKKVISNPGISDLVNSATPEDIAQAQQVLAALGLGGDGGRE